MGSVASKEAPAGRRPWGSGMSPAPQQLHQGVPSHWFSSPSRSASFVGSSFSSLSNGLSGFTTGGFPFLTAYARIATASFSTSKTMCESPPLPPLPPDPSAPKDAAPPPPPAPEGGGDIADAAKNVSAYTNPGPYEQAAMDGKRLVSLDTFDGFRCDINKQVSPYMLAIHSFWLGTSMIPDGRKSTYSFTTQVANPDGGIMMFRADPTRLSIDGRIHKPLLGGIALGKLQVGVSQDGQADQMLAEVDFGGLSWSGNLKYGSMGGGVVYGGNYLQAITPNLIMGGEGLYIAANQNAMANYTLKYTIPAKTGDEEEERSIQSAATQQPQQQGPPGMPPVETKGSSTMCMNYNAGQGACTMNYKRVVTPNRVSVGAELQFSPFDLNSQLLLGAEFKLARSKVNVCVDAGSSADNSWSAYVPRVQTVVEASLGVARNSPQLQFSADLDHGKDEMRFGYGITINGP